MSAMERISRIVLDQYKQQILDQTVLVRLDEAAAIMAVSRSTVIRRVEEGRIVPYNDNRTRKGLRFLASELREYVRQMRTDVADYC
jgi:excisionase family DNA binding protein